MNTERGKPPSERAARLVFLAACLGPLVPRLIRPSLYADDVPRLAQLQTQPLSALVLRPFNEHLAPCFELLSWLTWGAAGHRLAWAPLAFTVASLVPFPLTLWLLDRVLKRETGSPTAAQVGVALFALATIALETVYWYSASSFLWSLLAALAAWLAMARLLDCGPESVTHAGRLVNGLGIVLATALAPAFSAIGLLAAPLAMLRALVDPIPGRARWRVRAAGVLAATFGLGLYLVLLTTVRPRDGLAPSKLDRTGLSQGLAAAARAPAEVLVPSLVGGRIRAAAPLSVALTLGFTSVVVLAAWRGGPRHRPLLLGGLALMAGGYVLTYVPRAVEMGPALLSIQRYHLFPLLGLSFVAAGLAGSMGRRAVEVCDAQPSTSGWTLAALAMGLLVWHSGPRRGLATFLHDADQAPTLRALDQLHAVCVAGGITREQAIAALDPVGNRWTPAGENALDLLAAAADRPTRPDAQVRSFVLAALSDDDRRALCGGMNATPYLSLARASQPPADTTPRRLYRVERDATGRLVGEGWPSFVEFDLAPAGSSEGAPGAILLPADVPAGWVEVWWIRPGDRWSQTRSVRLQLDSAATRVEPDSAWRLPLARVPHWDPTAHRVRLLFHARGPIAATAPRLVR
ncbi:MAG: hypothetical protein U0794_03830 [Isosphaeraceae bacterium]